MAFNKTRHPKNKQADYTQSTFLYIYLGLRSRTGRPVRVSAMWRYSMVPCQSWACWPLATSLLRSSRAQRRVQPSPGISTNLAPSSYLTTMTSGISCQQEVIICTYKSNLYKVSKFSQGCSIYSCSFWPWKTTTEISEETRFQYFSN